MEGAPPSPVPAPMNRRASLHDQPSMEDKRTAGAVDAIEAALATGALTGQRPAWQHNILQNASDPGMTCTCMCDSRTSHASSGPSTMLQTKCALSTAAGLQNGGHKGSEPHGLALLDEAEIVYNIDTSDDGASRSQLEVLLKLLK